MRKRAIALPLVLAGLSLGGDCANDEELYELPETGIITVSISPPAAFLDIGEDLQLVAEVTGAGDRRVTWASSNENVATVASDGMLTAVAPGVGTVTARSVEDPAAVAAMALTVPLVNLEISPPSLTLRAGESASLGCALRSDRTANVITGQTVTWSSSDTQVADVAGDGTVTAVAVGAADVSCDVVLATTSYSATITVTVTDPSTASISGQVTVNGTGIAGATLVLTGDANATTATAAGGDYTFPGLAAGSHTITLSGVPGVGFPALAQAVTLAVGQAATVNFTGTNAPPVATIASPVDGQTYSAGSTIPFSGSANDPEEGALAGSALAWMSSLDGAIGAGTSFSRTLSVGAHTVTLTATDAPGATGSASVTITVTDPNPTASISGRVTGNGNGVGDATLTLSGPVSGTTASDGSGYYAFTMLPAGTYTVTVSVSLNISFPANPQTVTLASGEAATVDFDGTY